MSKERRVHEHRLVSIVRLALVLSMVGCRAEKMTAPQGAAAME